MNKDFRNVLLSFGLIGAIMTSASFAYRKNQESEAYELLIGTQQEESRSNECTEITPKNLPLTKVDDDFPQKQPLPIVPDAPVTQPLARSKKESVPKSPARPVSNTASSPAPAQVPTATIPPAPVVTAPPQYVAPAAGPTPQPVVVTPPSRRSRAS